MPTPRTEYSPLEPAGFGQTMFGNPTTGVLPDTGESVRIFSIHERGFGNPTTNWTEVEG